MRPEQKRRGRADRTARARLLIKAHLGWIGGYPLAAEDGRISWQVAEPGPRAIDRSTIAGATRAFKRLCGEHRGALPALVGDAEAWAAGVEAALVALKAVVHRGEELGDLLAVYPSPAPARGRRIAAARPALAPVVAALSWVDLAAPDRLAGDLRALERHAASFARLAELSPQPVDACLRLVELARAEEGRVAGLMAVLADPDLTATPTSLDDYPHRLGRRLDNAEIAIGARPAASLAPAVLELVDWIAAATPAVRRAALRAVALAEIPRYLGRWRQIWTALEPAEQLAARSREVRERVPRDHFGRCRLSLTWIPPAAPSPVNGAGMRRAIQRLSASDVRPLVALVAGSPDDDDLPIRLELMAGLVAELGHLDRASVAGLVALLRTYLARSPDPARAWRALVPILVAPRFRLAISLDDLLPPARWGELGEAMAELVAGGRDELEVESLLRLAVLVAATGSAAAAIRHLPALDAGAISPWNVGVRVALALGEEPSGFAELVARMARDDGQLAASVERVLGATGAAGARLVRALLADGESARLRDASGWIDLARAIRGCALPPLAVPAAPDAPAWTARYPAALQGALALAEAAGAREAAERKLALLFPDPASLRREIASIDARLSAGPPPDGPLPIRHRITGDDPVGPSPPDGPLPIRHRITGDDPVGPPPHLARRRANLVARLEAPRSPAPARLARLAAEIERGARASIFDRWAAAIERAALDALPRALGLADAPGWIASREHRAVLAALVGLRGESQRLVRRLLTTRAGPPPWDLRGDPANRAFLARLTRRRIAIEPWLDGIAAVRFDDPGGALHLALEPDPLEVLRMGEHFATCLAPGAVNFYSAVVNAVDINKRVVYGRDATGAVVGRCLLALTDAGHLLTFHPYHHRGDFAGMMRGFVGELARRMGTRVVAHGAVSPLVATRWYDDGPHDLTGRHDFLAEDSAFRQGLSAIAAEELVPDIEKRLGAALDGPSLALVVALEELDARPALVVPLLPLLDRATDVPLESRLRAIQLAERVGAADQLGARTAEHLAAGLADRLTDGRAALEPIDRLAALAPLRLLALVRGARRRVRPSERGGRPLLHYAAARAHRALGRPRRAADDYRRALDATGDKNLAAVCTTALRELSRPAR